MKYFFTLIICISCILLGGCSPVPGRYYSPITIPIIYKDIDGKLYFEYVAKHQSNFYEYYNLNTSNKKFILYGFDDNQKKWIKIATKKDSNITIISNEYNISQIERLFKKVSLPRSGYSFDKLINTSQFISYKNNIATIKDIDTNETIFTQTLPTIDEIQSSTNENFGNSGIAYTPMITGNYFWDQKTHLASVCIDKYKSNLVFKCDDIVIFSLIKNDDNWNISKIVSYKEHFKLSEYGGAPLYRSYLFDQYHYKIESFDNKVGQCMYLDATRKTCFLKDDDITFKKFFGEIYPIEYKNMLDNIYKNNVNATYNYTFDEQGNMHLFYNKREDIVSGNYDYFWYGYFTRENPTTPLYEQKIPWERE